MSRNLTVDRMKLGLACCVVCIHAEFAGNTSPFIHHLLVQGLFRLAVPVFFIFSGYYFYRVCQRGNGLRWMRRIAIMYGVWMALYGVMAFYEVPWKTTLLRAVTGYYHLWYIAGLLHAGMVLYLLRRLSSVVLGAGASILCIIGILVMYALRYGLLPDGVAQIIDTPSLHIIIYRNGLFFGFPLMVAGWLLHKHDAAHRQSSAMVSIMTIMSVLAVIVESSWHYQAVQGGDASGSFDMMLSVIISSLFCVMLALRATHTHRSDYLTYAPTAIYLLHPFMLAILAAFAVNGTILTSFAAIMMSAALSIPVITLHKRVPIFL